MRVLPAQALGREGGDAQPVPRRAEGERLPRQREMAGLGAGRLHDAEAQPIAAGERCGSGPQQARLPDLPRDREGAQPRGGGGAGSGAGKRAERVPERRAEAVEGGDLVPGKRPREPVAERAAEGEAGLRQSGARAVDPLAEDDAGDADRRRRGAEIEQTLAIDAAVGIDAGLVGGRHHPLDQFRVGEPAAEIGFHHRETARHHRRGERRSRFRAGVPGARAHVVAVRPEIGRPDTHAGRPDAPVLGDPAAVRPGSDAAVPADSHHGDHVPAQLGNPRREARRDRDRPGVYPIYAVHLHAKVGVACEVVRVAASPAPVADGEDEDGFPARAALSQRRDRSVEIGAELRL